MDVNVDRDEGDVNVGEKDVSDDDDDVVVDVGDVEMEVDDVDVVVDECDVDVGADVTGDGCTLSPALEHVGAGLATTITSDTVT